jgi:hypothetical protein
MLRNRPHLTQLDTQGSEHSGKGIRDEHHAMVDISFQRKDDQRTNHTQRHFELLAFPDRTYTPGLKRIGIWMIWVNDLGVSTAPDYAEPGYLPNDHLRRCQHVPVERAQRIDGQGSAGLRQDQAGCRHPLASVFVLNDEVGGSVVPCISFFCSRELAGVFETLIQAKNLVANTLMQGNPEWRISKANPEVVVKHTQALAPRPAD